MVRTMRSLGYLHCLRYIIDACSWTLDLVSWICELCGRHYCSSCQPSHQKCCDTENLPVSAISPVDIRRLAADLQTVTAHGMPVPSHGLSPSTPARNLEAVVLAANDYRHIPIIEGKCGLSDFDYLWLRGLPFVCRDGVRPDGKWSSDYLAACFGPDSCTLVDCEEPYGTRQDTVDSFLRSMSTSGPNVWKLKVTPVLRFHGSYPTLSLDIFRIIPPTRRSNSKRPYLPEPFKRPFLYANTPVNVVV